MLWGNTDVATNNVLFSGSLVNKIANTGNKTNMFGNTTPGAFQAGQAVGMFGVDTTEMGNTSGEGARVKAPGWVLRREGSGPVVSFTVSNVGTNFANGETFEVTGGAVTATGNITTNATSNIISVS